MDPMPTFCRYSRLLHNICWADVGEVTGLYFSPLPYCFNTCCKGTPRSWVEWIVLPCLPNHSYPQNLEVWPVCAINDDHLSVFVLLWLSHCPNSWKSLEVSFLLKRHRGALLVQGPYSWSEDKSLSRGKMGNKMSFSEVTRLCPDPSYIALCYFSRWRSLPLI